MTERRERVSKRIDVDGYRWLAIRIGTSLPNLCPEFIATDYLASLGLNVYCPMGQEWLLWESRHKRARPGTIKRQFPVFAQYIFCGLREDQSVGKDSRHHIKSILPDSMPPDAIRWVNQRELSGEWDTTKSWQEKSGLKVGDTVGLLDDRFVGLKATVSAIESEARIELLIEVFGRSTAFRVSYGQIKPL